MVEKTTLLQSQTSFLEEKASKLFGVQEANERNVRKGRQLRRTALR